MLASRQVVNWLLKRYIPSRKTLQQLAVRKLLLKQRLKCSGVSRFLIYRLNLDVEILIVLQLALLIGCVIKTESSQFKWIFGVLEIQKRSNATQSCVNTLVSESRWRPQLLDRSRRACREGHTVKLILKWKQNWQQEVHLLVRKGLVFLILVYCAELFGLVAVENREFVPNRLTFLELTHTISKHCLHCHKSLVVGEFDTVAIERWHYSLPEEQSVRGSSLISGLISQFGGQEPQLFLGNLQVNFISWTLWCWLKLCKIWCRATFSRLKHL